MPKLSNLKYNFAPVLRNKIVLYVFLAMTLVQVLFFVNSGDMAAVITLGLIGFLTSFFSKNMIVIMFVALTVSSLLQYGIRANAHEGLENQEGEQEPKNEEPSQADEQKSDEKKSEETPKKEETEEFAEVQKQILAGVEKMEPLLQKAEAFMDKYQNKKEAKGSLAK